ncbi:MAG: sulfatase-like hydrolase/transferase [Myxococcota bacterium]
MLFWLLSCSLMSTPEQGPAEPVQVQADAPAIIALITIDTWRADHFSEALTPNLWALGEAGEWYSNAWAPMGLTTPAHASMLTGLLPWEHGVLANNHHGYSLTDSVPVLPEQYPDHASGAFVSAYPAGPAGGLERGWDVFDGPAEGERPGTVTIEKAMAWIPSDRPSLLWIHVYEPHGPYVGEGYTERERYASEVRNVDKMMGPVLSFLKARGATIVVASDHGEVMDEERCGYQHERSISETVLRVPLIRWSPGIVPSVIDGWVGLNDVPTLLKGDKVTPRDHWVAQSGMCEPDCAPGCDPSGLSGRDTVVFFEGGRWIRRPGKGLFKEGQPPEQGRQLLDQVPPFIAPDQAQTDGAKSLGYIDP